MQTDSGSIAAGSESSLYGKLIGVVMDRERLTAVCDALSAMTGGEIEVLDGVPGIERLNTWHETVSQYFMGDMESEMVQRYLDAVHDGHPVFAASIAPDAAEQAAETAKALGASEIVHFGNSVITNY